MKLREKAFLKKELSNLYEEERARIKKYEAYCDLRSKFLDFVEKSNIDYLQEKFISIPFNSDLEMTSILDGCIMFADEAKIDGYTVDIVNNNKEYEVSVKLGTQTEEEKVKVKKDINDFLRIPFDYREDLDKYFKIYFSLHNKESVIEHPKYKEFEKILQKHYKKNLSLKAYRKKVLNDLMK